MISAVDRHAIAGISGGRTSGMMAYLVRALLSFQNTGREKAGTYDFIERLEQDLGRSIVRLEFRAPPRGEPPRFATFEIVKHGELARHGEPFRDMLECLRTFRAKHKGLGPVAPWARSRICTAYLKIRTQRKYCASLGWGDGFRHLDYIEYTGLRADEPDRVANMRERNDDLDTDERAPLHERGITKEDVLKFWSRKSFDLTIPEHDGNCTKCFLKDERDLATSFYEDGADREDGDFWIGIERDYAPMRRGGRPSYEQVRQEAPERMKLRAALATGIDPLTVETSLSQRRVKLIVAQEREPRQSFSCECDAAKAEDFDRMIEEAAA